MAKDTSAVFSTRNVDVGKFVVGARSSDSTNRQVVILVHGIGASEKYFRRLADELSSRYNVVSVTLPGYGETKKPPHALRLDELVEVLAQFIRQEHVARPVIIGHSMGCQIVARLGVVNDLALDKLILLSPTVNNKERTAPLQFWRLLQDTFREPLVSNLMLLSDYIKFGPLRYLKTQRHMIADTIETYLAQCTRPTLIVRGGRDKIVPSDWVEFLRATLKSGSLAEIKAGPHNFQYTHAREVARLCTEFIEQ